MVNKKKNSYDDEANVYAPFYFAGLLNFKYRYIKFCIKFGKEAVLRRLKIDNKKYLNHFT